MSHLPRSAFAIPLLAMLVACATSGAPPQHSPAIGRLTTFDASFQDVVAADAHIEKIAEGFIWSEGPAWIRAGGYLLFTDVPENTLYRWSERDGLSVFLEPSGDFIRDFTGDRELMMVGAQATRYLPGEFLRTHDDRHEQEARRFAYVLNLSRDWEADWGGLLHFVDDAGGVSASYVPNFNSLSLFKVPARHHVGLVAPWARQPRLAITGWWHATPRGNPM